MIVDGFLTPLYGMMNFSDLFNNRQLLALSTFSDLITDVHSLVLNQSELVNSSSPQIYADAITTYAAFILDRCANYWSSLTCWGGNFIVQTFGRQALPMVWDYSEANPFSSSTGNWNGAIEWGNQMSRNLCAKYCSRIWNKGKCCRT